MPFAGRLHDSDRGSSLLDIDEHNLLGHEKEFRIYVLNLAGEVRTDLCLLEDACVQRFSPFVGGAGADPVSLQLRIRTFIQSSPDTSFLSSC